MLSRARSGGAGTSLARQKVVFGHENFIDLLKFLCKNEFIK
jgi:hypothetical protein